jgi:hypothetical protein
MLETTDITTLFAPRHALPGRQWKVASLKSKQFKLTGWNFLYMYILMNISLSTYSQRHGFTWENSCVCLHESIKLYYVIMINWQLRVITCYYVQFQSVILVVTHNNRITRFCHNIYTGWFKAQVQYLMRLLGSSCGAENINNFFHIRRRLRVTTFLLWCRSVLLWSFEGDFVLRARGGTVSRLGQ